MARHCRATSISGQDDLGSRLSGVFDKAHSFQQSVGCNIAKAIGNSLKVVVKVRRAHSNSIMCGVAVVE